MEITKVDKPVGIGRRAGQYDELKQAIVGLGDGEAVHVTGVKSIESANTSLRTWAKDVLPGYRLRIYRNLNGEEGLTIWKEKLEE